MEQSEMRNLLSRTQVILRNRNVHKNSFFQEKYFSTCLRGNNGRYFLLIPTSVETTEGTFNRFLPPWKPRQVLSKDSYLRGSHGRYFLKIPSSVETTEGTF